VAVYLGIGIACCIIYAQHNTAVPTCGANGYPPLQYFVLGTGIAYLILAAVSIFALLLVLSVVGIPILLIVALCAGGFCFAWMIVGSVSLFRDGYDCQTLNYPIWAVAMAAVISSYVLFGLGLIKACCSKKDEDN
jgi:hypothetical protein